MNLYCLPLCYIETQDNGDEFLITRDADEVIQPGIEKPVAFYRVLGLPTTMQEPGIPTAQFTAMAEKAVQVRGTLGFFEPLSVADVARIYSPAQGVR